MLRKAVLIVTHVHIHTNFDKDSHMIHVLLVMAVAPFCCTVSAELVLVSQQLFINLSTKHVYKCYSLVLLAVYAVFTIAVHQRCSVAPPALATMLFCILVPALSTMLY